MLHVKREQIVCISSFEQRVNTIFRSADWLRRGLKWKKNQREENKNVSKCMVGFTSLFFLYISI